MCITMFFGFEPFHRVDRRRKSSRARSSWHDTAWEKGNQRAQKPLCGMMTRPISLLTLAASIGAGLDKFGAEIRPQGLFFYRVFCQVPLTASQK